jgi:hypothetical protein
MLESCYSNYAYLRDLREGGLDSVLSLHGAQKIGGQFGLPVNVGEGVFQM